MAQYCRYCGAKKKDRRDKFCCSCRKSGEPVDFFYRFAKETDMDEETIDTVRACGADLALTSLIAAFFPAFFLIFSLIMNSYGDVGRFYTPTVFIVILGVLVVIPLIFAFIGLGLVRLDKRFVDKDRKISVILLFLGVCTRNGGSAMMRAAFTDEGHYLKEALRQLAKCGKNAVKLPEINNPLSDWVCGYCGYKNPSGRMECKSCGRIK